MTEDEMVEWHHRLDGHEFGQALGVGDRQGSLACCSPWGCKKLDTTEGLNCVVFILHHSYGPLYQVVCYEGREVEIEKCSEADGFIFRHIFMFPP